MEKTTQEIKESIELSIQEKSKKLNELVAQHKKLKADEEAIFVEILKLDSHISGQKDCVFLFTEQK